VNGLAVETTAIQTKPAYAGSNFNKRSDSGGLGNFWVVEA
jgi:hypothetical protein